MPFELHFCVHCVFDCFLHQPSAIPSVGFVDCSTGDLSDMYQHVNMFSLENDWENTKIIGNESRWTQRSLLEGVELLREKSKGIQPLKGYNQLPY